MKNKSIITALLAGCLTLATSVKADGPADHTAPPTPPDQPHPSQSAQNIKETGRTEMASKELYLGFTHLISREVRSDTGERLGIVQDLIVNLDSDTAPFAVIRYGGALGMGGTHVAVPLKELKWSAETKTFSLAATKERFRAALPAPTGGWSAMADQEWAGKVDRFYGDPAKLDLSQFGRSTLTEPVDSREFIRDAIPPKPATEPAARPPTVDPGATQPPTADPVATQPPAVDPTDKVPLAKPADGDLSAKVTKLINLQAGSPAGGDVQATVENGVVTLKGKVATAVQKQDLETQIKALSGVTQVIDDQLSAPNE